jgi:hypothetical protein
LKSALKPCTPRKNVKKGDIKKEAGMQRFTVACKILLMNFPL